MKKYILLCLFAVGVFFNAEAKIELPAIFGSGMVLQQQTEVAIWGKARASFIVKIKPSWSRESYTVKSNNAGEWRVLLKTPAAGGPYDIVIIDDEKLILTNVLIGEVWVCSGQSNMEMPMKGFANQPILNSNDILAGPDNNSLRLFQVKKSASVVPEYTCGGQWQISSSESAANFSAIGFQFAKRLHEILKVPVGIIESTWGGTPIESWMDQESVHRFGQTQRPIPGKNDTADRLKTTCLFNGMINPIAGFGIKGFLWYQGESNVVRFPEYTELMRLMVEGWRKLWQRDSLYFYYVQIAPWKYGANRNKSALLREAQYNALTTLPLSGMVVSMDKGSDKTIHPPDKTAISNRLLYWALGDAYHKKGIAYKSPSFKSVVFRSDTAVLSFDHAPANFTSYDEEVVGFQIAGSDKIFHDARATIVKNNIEVISEEVKQPVAVRYAFTDFIKTNLFSLEGLPVIPFRTDSW